MKNLNYINCNELNEYDLVVHPKDEPGRGQLIKIRPSISVDFDSYLGSFPSIVLRAVSQYIAPESTALRGCYSIPTIQRDDLLKRIVDAQTIDFQEICGYCLLHLRTTIDHYVPKEEYSEYSILPKNLLPCCARCNTIKNRFWRQNDNRLFIHLYNDIIPDVRFLFGNLSFLSGTPVITYHISNNNHLIPNPLYATIETHFDRLDLCDVYSKAITKLISDIHTDIKGVKRIYPGDVTAGVFQNFLLSKSIDFKQRFGLNYWRAIGIDILANSNQFLNSL